MNFTFDADANMVSGSGVIESIAETVVVTESAVVTFFCLELPLEQL